METCLFLDTYLQLVTGRKLPGTIALLGSTSNLPLLQGCCFLVPECDDDRMVKYLEEVFKSHFHVPFDADKFTIECFDQGLIISLTDTNWWCLCLLYSLPQEMSIAKLGIDSLMRKFGHYHVALTIYDENIENSSGSFYKQLVRSCGWNEALMLLECVTILFNGKDTKAEFFSARG